MGTLHVGPAQTYATIMAAYNATTVDGGGAYTEPWELVLHATTFTEELDFDAHTSGAMPIMTDTNRLSITVNPTDVVVWNDSGGGGSCLTGGGTNLYLTIDGSAGTLTIQGSSGDFTYHVNWANQITLLSFNLFGDAADAGSRALYSSSGAPTHNCDWRIEDMVIEAVQSEGIYFLLLANDFGPTGHILRTTFQNIDANGWRSGSAPKLFGGNPFLIDDCDFTTYAQGGAGGNAIVLEAFRGQGDIEITHNRFTGTGMNGGAAVAYGSNWTNDVVGNLLFGENLFYNCHQNVSVFSTQGGNGSYRFDVYNNTFDGENATTLMVFCDGRRDNGTVWNFSNDIFYDGNVGIQQHGSFHVNNQINIDWNCWFSMVVNVVAPLAVGGNAILADPLFVNEAADDYHLTAPSPCRDTGNDVGYGDDVGRFQFVTAIMTLWGRIW
jgi:hypothetical protein